MDSSPTRPIYQFTARIHFTRHSDTDNKRINVTSLPTPVHADWPLSRRFSAIAWKAQDENVLNHFSCHPNVMRTSATRETLETGSQCVRCMTSVPCGCQKKTRATKFHYTNSPTHNSQWQVMAAPVASQIEWMQSFFDGPAGFIVVSNFRKTTHTQNEKWMSKVNIKYNK